LVSHWLVPRHQKPRRNEPIMDAALDVDHALIYAI